MLNKFVPHLIIVSSFFAQSAVGEVVHHVAIVGAQFGDEGKGAITDYLAEQANVVVRFNGGNNAGHTVVVGDQVYKFRSLPSGVVRPDKLNIIANGAVVNPVELIREIDAQAKKGLTITPKQLLIAENVPLVLALHEQIDQFREVLSDKTGQKIGTTGNGIGPAYEDKVGRRAVRMADLIDVDKNPLAKDNLHARIERLVGGHFAELRKFADADLVLTRQDRAGGITQVSARDLYSDQAKLVKSIEDGLLHIAPRVIPYISHARPIWKILKDSDRKKKRILFEGGQAVLLDIDHGTYPYVTSSNTLGTSIYTGSGFMPRGGRVHVLGVAKAYVTRVGNGPFPSKIEGDLGDEIRKKGHEFGTVTGRPRDVGWLDLVALKQAVTVGGIHSLALTKIDVLDGVETLQVVTDYQYESYQLDFIPLQQWMWKGLQAVYHHLPGWKKTAKINRLVDLPKELLNLISLIESHAGVPVSMVTTGPERADKVILNSRFDF